MAKKRKSSSKDEASSKEPKPAPKIEKPPPPPPSPSSSSSDESYSESSESEEEQVKTEEEEDEESSSSSSSSSEDEDSKREKIKKLLEPFGKEQLINIIKDAATTNPSILSGIIASAESDPVHRKIFVHGLGWDATNETLSAAFKQFGPIEECNVIADKVTGRSKGYGFVLFKTHSGARKALKQPEKKIGSRMVACQLASTGPVQNNQQQQQQQQGSDPSLRKLYVANVGPQINAEKLRAFLAKFGEIEDGPLGIDKVTGKFRGYAIFVYKTLEGIKKALEEPVKVFDGVNIQCSVAIEKKSAKNNVAAGGSNVAATGAKAAVVQGNVAMPGLPVTLNQGLAGQNLNPGAVFMGQNPVFGVLNPVLGLGGLGAGGAMNNTVLNPAFPGGVLQSLNRVGNTHPMNPPMGLSVGFGVKPPISSISPSVMANYGSQSVVHGMGAYQGPQLGQSSAPGAAVAIRPNASAPPYLPWALSMRSKASL